MIDTTAIRTDFPILQQTIFGNPLVYFDNAATTQKPRCVVNKMAELYFTQNANIHRGVHHLSRLATEAHEQARCTVADFLHATDAREIIFTRGTTEAVNLVADCFAQFCAAGDEIIISQMEHHSNIVPWQMAAQRAGLTLKIIPIDPNGDLNLDRYSHLLTDRTRLVAVSHVSNVLGSVNPVAQIIAMAHHYGVPVLIDGAQAVAHQQVDVQALDADFYAFSGHKLYAPTGIGALYGKTEWLDRLPPYQGGGEMIERVSFQGTTFNALPYKFEAGTPDYIGSVALAEAIAYVERIGLAAIAAHEAELTRYALSKMNEIEGMKIFGNPKQRSGVISFQVGNIHHFDLGTLLDKVGIAIRTGHHCAQPLVESLGVSGTARISFALYNTMKEIDLFIEKLKRVISILG
ncbi:MAG: cysteine desulfurase [Prevotellaceae bacterium]|jgi:cysteine desulfurase/selenocysteine lyase|nr:cysteine desulfurase [Prevotellaceae bacterium]